MAVPSVLIVDDHHQVRLEIRRVLMTLLPNCSVYEAPDGAAALAKLSEISPDLILLDGEMPVLNGYETALRLRRNAQTAAVPLVALLETTDRHDLAIGLKALCNAFVRKPLAGRDLAKTVARLINLSPPPRPGETVYQPSR